MWGIVDVCGVGGNKTSRKGSKEHIGVFAGVYVDILCLLLAEYTEKHEV